MLSINAWERGLVLLQFHAPDIVDSRVEWGRQRGEVRGAARWRSEFGM